MQLLFIVFMSLAATANGQSVSDFSELAAQIEKGLIEESTLAAKRLLNQVAAKTHPPMTIADVKGAWKSSPDRRQFVEAVTLAAKACAAKDWRACYFQLRVAQKGLFIAQQGLGPEGRLNEARRVSESSGAGFDTTYQHGVRAYEARQYSEALAQADRTIELLRGSGIADGLFVFVHRAITIRGMAQLALGDADAARRSLLASVAMSMPATLPGRISPRSQLAKLFLDRGDRAVAIEYFERLAEKWPGYRETAQRYKSEIEAGLMPAFSVIELSF
jgi:tetratricopeptide (TPR) repeat protein